MGRAAFFIRTFGCPVKCPWCDSAGTWHPDWVPKRINRASVESLVAAAAETKSEFVVVTGGEPAIHNLSKLTSALTQAGLASHIETSGAFTILGDFAWVTVSPKWAKPPLKVNLQRASEWKIIVESVDSIEKWWNELGAHHRGQPIWLHPEWSQRNNPEVLNAISTAVKTRGGAFRAGYQLHRLFNVDSIDSRSAPAVPLGGNPALGR